MRWLNVSVSDPVRKRPALRLPCRARGGATVARNAATRAEFDRRPKHPPHGVAHDVTALTTPCPAPTALAEPICPSIQLLQADVATISNFRF